jgi:membrane protein
MTRADVWPLAKQTFNAWSRDKVPRLAAALSAVHDAVAGAAAGHHDQDRGRRLGRRAATDQVKQNVAGFVGPRRGGRQDMIAKAGRPGEGGWRRRSAARCWSFSATALFASIQDALNTIWGVKPKPGPGDPGDRARAAAVAAARAGGGARCCSVASCSAT